MSATDYTLPPVPEPDGPPVLDGYHEVDMLDYGHACAEAVRTPLLAEIDRLRAEVEALRKAGGMLATAVYNNTGITAPLNSAQRECLNNARIRWDATIAAQRGEGE